MFHRRFIRQFRGPWADAPREPGPHHDEEWEGSGGSYGPHHHGRWDPRVEALRNSLREAGPHGPHRHGPGKHFRGEWRPPFGWEEDVPFSFGPRGRPPFDRPFWRGGP